MFIELNEVFYNAFGRASALLPPRQITNSPAVTVRLVFVL